MPTQLMFPSERIIAQLGGIGQILVENELSMRRSETEEPYFDQEAFVGLGIAHLLNVVYGSHPLHNRVLNPQKTAGERLFVLERAQMEGGDLTLTPTVFGTKVLDALEAVGVTCPITID